jgi:hypothetical protein
VRVLVLRPNVMAHSSMRQKRRSSPLPSGTIRKRTLPVAEGAAPAGMKGIERSPRCHDILAVR